MSVKSPQEGRQEVITNRNTVWASLVLFKDLLVERRL